MGQGRVVEGEGRGARHGARHVRDAVMNHVVDDEGRIAVGRGVRRLDAAALVDGDVDDHRARLHPADHVGGDELRGGRARNEHPADHHVRVGDVAIDRGAGGVQGVERAAELAPQRLERLGGAVDGPRIGAHPHRDVGGVGPDHAAADDDDLGRQHSRHAAEQDSAPAVDPFEGMGGGLDRESPGDFRHGREEGQAAGR